MQCSAISRLLTPGTFKACWTASATTWRIRSAIKKIAAAHPGLGKHLQNSVRTGALCVYRPERSVGWEL